MRSNTILLWPHLVLLLAVSTNPAMAEDPPVCDNEALLEAVQIISSACDKQICDFEELKRLDSEVDRQSFLGALSNPHLRAVHLFFPANEFHLAKAFDWETSKPGQVGTLKYIDEPERAVVFVIGSASVSGAPGSPGDDHNRQLSYSRMEAVLKYLRDDIQIPCRDFRIGWLGREVLQLTRSDAAFLGIATQDFRGDELVLNQAVHMFVFPCGERLP